jgi:hypothetical protein
MRNSISKITKAKGLGVWLNGRASVKPGVQTELPLRQTNNQKEFQVLKSQSQNPMFCNSHQRKRLMREVKS